METHTCIVLRQADYRDNDKMLTLFSRTEGKLGVMARGVRKAGSKLAAAAQPLATGEYELHRTGGRLYLRGATVKQEYPHVQTDYDSFTAACVMLEGTERMLSVTGEYGGLFVTLIHSLYAMETGSVSPDMALAYYLVQAAERLGVLADLLVSLARAEGSGEMITAIEVLRRIDPRHIEAAGAVQADFAAMAVGMIRFLSAQLRVTLKSAELYLKNK